MLRIKQAQCALAAGRLDEAFGLAAQPDFQAHRDGQALIDRLIEAMVRRGQEHLSAGRAAEAQADCEKAALLGGNLSDVGGLRAKLAEAVAGRQRQDRYVARIAAAAREHLDHGRLSAGEQVLAGAAGEGAPVAANGRQGSAADRLGAIQHELAARRAAAEKALDLAEAALGREDLGASADELLRAGGMLAGSSRLADLSARLVAMATAKVRSAMEQGRLRIAQSMLQRLGPLAARGDELPQIKIVLDDCARAGGLVHAGRHREAAQMLRRLSLSAPGAAWLPEAAGRIERAAGEIEAVLSGPLALLAPPGAMPGAMPLRHEAYPAGAEGNVRAPKEEAGKEEKTARGQDARGTQGRDALATGAASPLPSKFVMLVDGVGSYLVTGNPRVTIGPVSSSSRPDLGLVTDPSLPTIAIERLEEDYFLRCERPVFVNDKPVTSKLLANSDVIALSAGAAKCRIRFGLPHPASTTAVLSLSGTRLPRLDVRQVVLLGREMILGPGATAHVRVDAMDIAVALLLREGRLVCRGAGATVDGRPLDERIGIPMGEAVRIGPVSLVLTSA
jgi:hypothetical protein